MWVGLVFLTVVSGVPTAPEIAVKYLTLLVSLERLVVDVITISSLAIDLITQFEFWFLMLDCAS